MRARGATAPLRARLARPLDASGLAAFRAAFGLLMAWSMARFFLYGWIDELFVKPRFFFKYWGFAWVPVPGPAGLRALFGGLLVLALCVSAGLFYRAAIVLFAVGFAWVQLLDLTNYLNHYYLVLLIAALFACMPLGRAWSIDAWLRPRIRAATFPAWQTYLLRFQVGVVYVFAGLAKAGGDWLLHAQPLELWLAARTTTPVLGPLLDRPLVAFAMSWAGFLFDTTVVAFLLARRTRPWAYAVVVVFHATTSLLFPIGMFPWIMIAGAAIFFEPDWPRRALARLGAKRIAPAREVSPEDAPGARLVDATTGAASDASARVPRFGLALGLAYCAAQVLVPLRCHAYGGDVLWHEQGMRFAWKVMVREKNAAVTYLVSEASGRTWEVSPTPYLTDRQLREFGTQPDMILQLAKHVAREWEATGARGVQVRADVQASLNGRRAQRLIDPTVDLAAIDDGLAKARWILPAPTSAPARLRPLGAPR